MYTLLFLFVAYTAVYSLIWHLQSSNSDPTAPRPKPAQTAQHSPASRGSAEPSAARGADPKP